MAHLRQQDTLHRGIGQRWIKRLLAFVPLRSKIGLSEVAQVC